MGIYDHKGTVFNFKTANGRELDTPVRNTCDWKRAETFHYITPKSNSTKIKTTKNWKTKPNPNI